MDASVEREFDTESEFDRDSTSEAAPLPTHHLVLITAAAYGLFGKVEIKSVTRAVQVGSSWAKNGRHHHHRSSNRR